MEDPGIGDWVIGQQLEDPEESKENSRFPKEIAMDLQQDSSGLDLKHLPNNQMAEAPKYTTQNSVEDPKPTDNNDLFAFVEAGNATLIKRGIEQPITVNPISYQHP